MKKEFRLMTVQELIEQRNQLIQERKFMKCYAFKLNLKKHSRSLPFNQDFEDICELAEESI